MEGRANVATITFSWACRTHVYKNQLHDMATSNCVLCGSNLPSCRERRVLYSRESGGSCVQERAWVLYSRESCHVVSTAVDLLRKCVPHGCATNLESSFFMSTTLFYHVQSQTLLAAAHNTETCHILAGPRTRSLPLSL